MTHCSGKTFTKKVFIFNPNCRWLLLQYYFYLPFRLRNSMGHWIAMFGEKFRLFKFPRFNQDESRDRSEKNPIVKRHLVRYYSYITQALLGGESRGENQKIEVFAYSKYVLDLCLLMYSSYLSHRRQTRMHAYYQQSLYT